ncbi:unnamed protein product [Macrosiphum euphorbiae]|uniref:Reverse transcriptase RNase H-like domain-containing protein n=1 Tax=Macrosiphum euphorbiae TaxID=13131 RepID=A0AAV0YBE2_9HEMI|nr:unnamed protein product [Macrosiphum euphorbiae]
MYSPTAVVTEVHTDASSKGLSGILLQGDKQSSLKIVYHVSERTTRPESNYHSSQLESYAIIWTLNRLRLFLLGIRFTVVTDCQALTYLDVNKTTKPPGDKRRESRFRFTKPRGDKRRGFRSYPRRPDPMECPGGHPRQPKPTKRFRKPPTRYKDYIMN